MTSPSPAPWWRVRDQLSRGGVVPPVGARRLLVQHLVAVLAVGGRGDRVELVESGLDVELADVDELDEVGDLLLPEAPLQAVLLAELDGRHQEPRRIDRATEGHLRHVAEDRLVAELAVVQVVEQLPQLGAVLAPLLRRHQDRGLGHELDGRVGRRAEDRQIVPLADDVRLRDGRRGGELLALLGTRAGHAREAGSPPTAVGEAGGGVGGLGRTADSLQQLHSKVRVRVNSSPAGASRKSVTDFGDFVKEMSPT